MLLLYQKYAPFRKVGKFGRAYFYEIKINFPRINRNHEDFDKGIWH